MHEHSPYAGADEDLDPVADGINDLTGEKCPDCGGYHEAGLGAQFYDMAAMLGREFPLITETLHSYLRAKDIDPAVLDGLDDDTWMSLVTDASVPNVQAHVTWTPEAMAASKYAVWKMLEALKTAAVIGQTLMTEGVLLHPRHATLMANGVAVLDNMIGSVGALEINPLFPEANAVFPEQQTSNDLPLLAEGDTDGRERFAAYTGTFGEWFDGVVKKTQQRSDDYEDALAAAVAAGEDPNEAAVRIQTQYRDEDLAAKAAREGESVTIIG